MQPTAMQPTREQYIGKTIDWSTIGLGVFVLVVGAVLIALPLFGITLAYRRLELPGIVVQVVGGVAVLAGIAALVLLPKTKGLCKACNKGFDTGEAAFPPEVDAAVRPAIRALDPQPLVNAPVGSRFGDGPHFTLDYCPGCRQVGEISLFAPPGQKGYEFEDRLIVGPVVGQLVQVCEHHEEVREAHNNS